MIPPELAAMGSLNCVYFALLAVGVLYSLVVLVTGELHDYGVSVDVAGPDAGVDVLHGEIDIMSISPITIAGFVTAFGAFGLIATSLAQVSTTVSLIWAAAGGVVVGLVTHVAFIYLFIKPQGSSEFTRRDLVGATAEVVTPIPVDKVGEIALVAQGARVTMTARAAPGVALPRGMLVRVDDVVGSVAFVAPPEAGAEPS